MDSGLAGYAGVESAVDAVDVAGDGQRISVSMVDAGTTDLFSV
jgi:hypothetical protein